LNIGIEGNQTLQFEGQTTQWSKETTSRGHSWIYQRGNQNT